MGGVSMGGMVATLTVIRHQKMWKVGDPPHTIAVLQPLPCTFILIHGVMLCLIACAGRDLHGATMMAMLECVED